MVSIVVGAFWCRLLGLLWRFGVFLFVVGAVWLWFRLSLVGWLVRCGDLVFSCLSLGLFGCGFDRRCLVGLLLRFGVIWFGVWAVWLWFRSSLFG